MPKVSIVPPDRAADAAVPAAEGAVHARAYFAGARRPLHLHRVTVEPGRPLRLTPAAADRVGYVLSGDAVVGDHALPGGSSLIVERGARVAIEATAPADLLLFAGTRAGDDRGGRVHLLPAGRVPRAADLGGGSGTGGAIHADGGCPTSTVWLHENRMRPVADEDCRDAAAGIHQHSEDEIIFVTDGAMRLGTRLYGAGSALFVAADTLYGFMPGPRGLRFVNFRAGRPGDIRFANGRTISETAYWRDRLPRPAYIEA